MIDVGAYHGEFFRRLGPKLAQGHGVEPLLAAPIRTERFAIKPGYLPAVGSADLEWDVVSLLAVLEHIPRAAQAELAQACHRYLKSGGLVIVTVPSPCVDRSFRSCASYA